MTTTTTTTRESVTVLSEGDVTAVTEGRVRRRCPAEPGGHSRRSERPPGPGRFKFAPAAAAAAGAGGSHGSEESRALGLQVPQAACHWQSATV